MASVIRVIQRFAVYLFGLSLMIIACPAGTWAEDGDRRFDLSDEALAMARRVGDARTLARLLHNDGAEAVTGADVRRLRRTSGGWIVESTTRATTSWARRSRGRASSTPPS